MDLLSELGALAFGSRLKRLSDLIMKQAAEVYKSYEIDFEPKWFPLFYLLAQRKQMGIMEIAEKLNVTHPAVIQIAKELEKKGWVSSQKSSEDGRKRILRLTKKGLIFLPKLQKIWEEIRVVNESLLNEQRHKLLPAVEELETILTEKNYITIFAERRPKNSIMEVQIIDYQPLYKEDFKRLNVEWIEKFFKVEPHDLEQLDDPEGYILSKGGQIFFAQYNNEIVGTCALIKVAEGEYELAKMGVSPKYQGIGAGKKLCQKVIDTAKEIGAKYLFLESNQSLTPALTMYKSLGFVEVPIGETPFARANFKAEMYF